MGGENILEAEKSREPGAQDFGGRGTGGRLGRVALAGLFGLFLFAAGILVCIKPICSRAIHEAFLGRSVALRVNDVIWMWMNGDDIDCAVEIQEKVEEHAQLERIAAKYLDALADFSGSDKVFVSLDISGELAVLNEDIIRMLESERGQKLGEEQRQSVIRGLEGEEAQVIGILDDLPYFIGNFGEPARLAIRLYRILTSRMLLAAVALVLVFLGVWMYRAQERKGAMLWHMAVPFLVDGGMLGVILPMVIGRIGMQITNRVLGRAGEVDVSPMRYAGCLFVGIAFVLILAGFLQRSGSIAGSNTNANMPKGHIG